MFDILLSSSLSSIFVKNINNLCFSLFLYRGQFFTLHALGKEEQQSRASCVFSAKHQEPGMFSFPFFLPSSACARVLFRQTRASQFRASSSLHCPFPCRRGNLISVCRDRFPFAEARNACTQSYEHRSVVAADDTGWHCARAWYHTRSR